MADGQKLADHDGFARIVNIERRANSTQVYVEDEEEKARRHEHG
jgi:hypothetical protein